MLNNLNNLNKLSKFDMLSKVDILLNKCFDKFPSETSMTRLTSYKELKLRLWTFVHVTVYLYIARINSF